MKAIRVSAFGGPEVLKLVSDAVLPSPAKGEVVVKLCAAGVNPVETYTRSGNYASKPTLPYIPGSDGAGIVEAVSEGVENIKVGERVWLYGAQGGTYAEQCTCSARKVLSLPEGLSFSQGAALGVPYLTAYRALFHRLLARPLETVLVHGASGAVGTAAVQLARARGLTVLGTAGTPEGEEVVKRSGAHHVFNHRSADYVQQIKDVTGGKGVNLIVEMLANVSLNTDLLLVAPKGRIGVVGNRGTIEISPRDTMAKESSIIGVGNFLATEDELNEAASEIQAGLEGGWLNPIIGHQYPLSEAAEAHREIIEGSGAKGKIVLTVKMSSL